MRNNRNNGNPTNGTTYPNYEGKVIFITSPAKMGYSGEYYVIAQTSFSVLCVKITARGVWDARYLNTFELIGERGITVLEVAIPSRETIQAFIDDLWISSHAPERGEKPNWNVSIYAEGKSLAQRIANKHRLSLPSQPGSVNPVTRTVNVTFELFQKMSTDLINLQVELAAFKAQLRKLGA